MFFTLFLGQSWFSQNEKSSKIFVTSNTKTFSNRDGSLVKAGEEESNGFDVLGNFNSTKIQWNPSEVGFTTELRTYQEEPMIVFSQRFQVCNLTPGVAESSLPHHSNLRDILFLTRDNSLVKSGHFIYKNQYPDMSTQFLKIVPRPPLS